MTRDARVGRVLVAALQQAIAEELPTRSEFYDHWLAPDGRRDGTLGIAPMAAVVGFLRTEGGGYDRVVRRAGALVAEWTWRERAEWRRRWTTRLPLTMRARAVSRHMRAVVTETCSGTVARCRVTHGVVSLEIDDSVFCSAREAPAAPLCGFYMALFVEACSAAGLSAEADGAWCRTRPADVAPTGKGSGCGGRFVVSLAG
ncbi:MAG: hypothetical protein AMXMBFR57_11790 [Acidimicrobiia bacterium]|jgi:hypothetical protein